MPPNMLRWRLLLDFRFAKRRRGPPFGGAPGVRPDMRLRLTGWKSPVQEHDCPAFLHGRQKWPKHWIRATAEFAESP